MKRDDYLFIFPAVVIIFMDQVSKFVVAGTIKVHESIAVIKGFFNLVHVRNSGMAFGFLNRPDFGMGYYVLVGATIVAILLLLYWFNRIRNRDGRLIFGLSLILGGAIGNLIDRLRLKEVVDFLDFYIGQYHWPSFNLADSSITVGAFWVALNILFSGSSEPEH